MIYVYGAHIQELVRGCMKDEGSPLRQANNSTTYVGGLYYRLDCAITLVSGSTRVVNSEVDAASGLAVANKQGAPVKVGRHNRLEGHADRVVATEATADATVGDALSK